MTQTPEYRCRVLAGVSFFRPFIHFKLGNPEKNPLCQFPHQLPSFKMRFADLANRSIPHYKSFAFKVQNRVRCSLAFPVVHRTVLDTSASQ